ncbi:MAG TPA: selenoneine biosynthesis selenosugar synthase SenB, partial [Burkholderiales bacterium]
MKIVIVTPAKVTSRTGNRNTALRWAGFLRELGHRVRVQTEWDGGPADLMLALHARKSHASIRRFRDAFPGRALVLALTGTDLYRDIRTDPDAQWSMQVAHRMIVLQDMGLKELSPALRRKTRVIYQSAPACPRLPPLRRSFEVCVIGHLREEKDPFRAALALDRLPPSSRIRVTQLGRALDARSEHEARALMARNSGYVWLGEVPHGRVRQVLARSRAMVISSRMEGGANVVCEALAAGVPVIASRIPGNVGMLGRDYAGYYPLEDTAALARLMIRAETDPRFLARLAAQCRARRSLVAPAREKAGLAALLRELFPIPAGAR